MRGGGAEYLARSNTATTTRSYGGPEARSARRLGSERGRGHRPPSRTKDARLGRRVRFVVADVRGRNLLGLLERVPARGPNPDRDPVADLELARRDDGRHAGPPEDEDRAVAVAE